MKKKFVLFVVALTLLCVNVSAVSQVRICSRTIDATEQNLSFKGSYPRVYGMDNEKAQSDLNTLYRENAQKAMLDAKLAANGLSQGEIQSGMKAEGIYQFKVRRNGCGIFSLTTSNYLFSGGAHGTTVQLGSTVNATSGKQYLLKDLFTNESDAFAFLNDQIQEQIKKRGLTPIVPFETVKPNEGYYLTDTDLVVFFQQYEYFPYSDGIQEFAIPLKNLENVLIPEIRACK